MSEPFGDKRAERRRQHAITVRCGSCREREGTITLAVSGLRRCKECFAGMDLEAKHTRASARQPELEATRAAAPQTQPFASIGSLVPQAKNEFKRRASGE